MENSDLVEMTFTYTRHSNGSITEVVKIAGQEARRGPSPVVFLELPDLPPWEKEAVNVGNRKSDEAATR